MSTSIVVTYSVKPEALDEHLRLIAAVFAELDRLALATVEYEVLRLQDGVSFVHVSTSTSAAGTTPLPGLPAFQEFSRDLPSRVATPPSPSPATIVGVHRPAPDGA